MAPTSIFEIQSVTWTQVTSMGEKGLCCFCLKEHLIPVQHLWKEMEHHRALLPKILLWPLVLWPNWRNIPCSPLQIFVMKSLKPENCCSKRFMALGESMFKQVLPSFFSDWKSICWVRWLRCLANRNISWSFSRVSGLYPQLADNSCPKRTIRICSGESIGQLPQPYVDLQKVTNSFKHIVHYASGFN